MKRRRKIPLVVISDVHLGTYGCQAKELLQYLKSINPQTLVLNGDIIDMWSFTKSYFPASHMNVLRQIIKMSNMGTRVIYITGNHDEALRKYSDFILGNFELLDKLILDLDGKKTWIFHGDVFDSSTQGYAKILAKLGGKGYDLLILINSLINWFLGLLGKEKRSYSKMIKDSVKKAVSFVSNFETTAAEIAIQKNYSYVICGHIHKPQMKEIKNEQGSVIYLNSGDWIENLTALEYKKQKWSLYHYKREHYAGSETQEDKAVNDIVNKILS
ncbi:UDP-2,3-diacylglucosamine diphosphatase [Flavobacterium aquicola]|uniref:UDP-2,3-diacylglucosamine pyrophosphatase LpxH n=1 Tax=Flavobacterium aquicola TaxID=1682742 RepID=A0A3E0EK91_9FLAO|nr:UDP-2,3-diacylglucosamine diphosphatase [Flavobacterium aquicola]REG98170.1 UDP-2,3-diacylglucosamine pyrophosphatase LpxH [Flavobacterium aquicola]